MDEDEKKTRMKILFCGTAVPDTIEYQVKDISAAGNRFQNNMICSLKALGHEVDTVSYVAMEIPETLKGELLNSDDVDDGRKGKQYYIFRQNGGIKATLKAIKKSRETVRKRIAVYNVVFCYNVFYSFLFLPKMAGKFHKRNILILADYSGPESFCDLRNKSYALVQRKIMRQYDVVVGLSANIQKNLKGNQQFILMEGGIDERFYNHFAEKKVQGAHEIIFMYSGLLSKVTGVDILLQVAGEMKEKNFRLWISGKGELEQQVCEAAEKDERICYLGHMEYGEYIQTLKNADVLINPRNMNLPENQNNFPSKIMDYLATGKTVISSKFVGWEKFSENIIFYDDVDMLKQEMEKCINGQYAKKDVYKKNRQMAFGYLWRNQLKRILGNEL